MNDKELQELLLTIMPHWHYHIAKPFKQMLDSGVSPEMYFSIQLLRQNSDMLTMSELASRTRMPKQQMTKIVNKLIEYGFAERVRDSSDRRIIRLHVTEKAIEYVDNFLEKEASNFRDLFLQMSCEDKEDLINALKTIQRILDRLPVKCCKGNHYRSDAADK